MHYTPSGTEAFDISKIGLNFVSADQVDHQIFTTIAIDQDFEIPPNVKDHIVRFRIEPLHHLGSQLRYERCRLLVRLGHGELVTKGVSVYGILIYSQAYLGGPVVFIDLRHYRFPLCKESGHHNLDTDRFEHSA